MGARKIAVAALGPLGCIPAMTAGRSDAFPCIESVNDAVALFNNRLKILVQELNDALEVAQFIYISAMDLRPSQIFAPG